MIAFPTPEAAYFDTLRRWADTAAIVWGSAVHVQSRGPSIPHRSFVVDLSFTNGTEVQVTAWASGMLDWSIGTTPDDIAHEHHEFRSIAELATILTRIHAALRTRSEPPTLAGHFTGLAEHNLHHILDPAEMQAIQAALAATPCLRTVTIPDALLRSEPRSLPALWEAFELWSYPGYADDESRREPNWNATIDLLGDLSWLTDTAPDLHGFVLVIESPAPASFDEVLLLARFLDAVTAASHRLLRRGYGFHIVVGPVDPRLAELLNMLRVAGHFCERCGYGAPPDDDP